MVKVDELQELDGAYQFSIDGKTFLVFNNNGYYFQKRGLCTEGGELGGEWVEYDNNMHVNTDDEEEVRKAIELYFNNRLAIPA